MEKLVQLVQESFEDSSVKIIETKKFEEYDQFDSLTAMMLVDALREHYNLELEVESIGGMTILEVKDSI